MHLADVAPKLGWSSTNGVWRILDAGAGRVVVEPKRTKVCIYGAGIGKNEAPLKDTSWEVWCLNLIPAIVREVGESKIRADRWFDIHQRTAQTKDDLRWISQCPIPIYIPTDLMGASERCVRYPIEAIEEAFGGGYWSCTFAYQIALALYEGFEDIGLYGVELAYGTRRERTVEWACVSWWMGYAEARGVRFHLPFGSRMGAHPYRYGLEYHAEIDDVNNYLKTMRDLGQREADLGRKSVGG